MGAAGKIVLLGPQGTAPTVGGVLAALGIRERVALVRAGYQEREADDKEMVATLRVPAVNLGLHARAAAVFRDDRELTIAYKARQQQLRHMQSFHRVRLDRAEDSARTISRRHVDADLLEQEEKVSVDEFRYLDAAHVERCTALHAAFTAKWQPAERPVIAHHREELRAQLASCEALVIAGGHVASLYNRLALFDVMGLAAGKLVIAWSAGAMVLTERIVLFHDYPPYGSDIAQVLQAGLGLVPGLVVLPDPRRRINLAARAGIQRFARRMAPATCVAMDTGARIVLVDGHIAQADAIRLTTSGAIEHNWDGAPSRFSSPFLKLGVPR
jgi:peptidase E